MLAPGMTSMAQAAANSIADLTAPTPPAAQSLASTATTASGTYTHPGAPGGTTYALTVTDEADASVTPSSGSGLGPYVFPVASGKAYKARLRATGSDGQVADGVALVYVATAAPAGWTEIGRANFIGATPQTFSTTGSKTVTLADASTIAVNAAQTTGSIASANASADATRGLVCDIPAATATTAIRLRVTVPVSPSIADDDDLLVSVRWRASLANGASTTARALVGVTTASGTETSAEHSAMELRRTTADAANVLTRKADVVAVLAASPTGWRDGSVLMQADVRVVGSFRSLLATASPRDVDSGAPTYVGDIGGPSVGPLTGLDPQLFTGASVAVLLYSWNGGASGPAVESAIEEIVIYSRDTARHP